MGLISSLANLILKIHQLPSKFYSSRLRRIRSLTYTPSSRNPNLARTMGYFERIEEQGDGIRRIVRESAEHGLPQVEFDVREGFFTVVFHAPKGGMKALKPAKPRVLQEVSPQHIKDLNDNQKTILKALFRDGRVTVKDMAKALGVTPQAVRKDMAGLQDLGLVEQHGLARTTYYILPGANA